MRKYFILTVITLAVVLCGCSPKKTPGNFTSEQIKALDNIPYDTRFLIYMNLEKLKTSSLWKNNLKSNLPGAQTGSWLDKFYKSSGIKLNESISETYDAFSETGKDFKIFVLNSNYKKIKSAFSNTEMFNQQYVNSKGLLSTKDRRTYFYFITDRMLAVCTDSATISKVITKQNGKITGNQKFMKAANNIFNKKYYWMIADDNEYFLSYLQTLSRSEKGIASDLVNSVTSFTIAADFKDGSKIEFNLGCKDAKSAFLITNGIKSAVAMGLLTHNDKAMDYMFNKMKIERFESSVNMNIELSDDDISKLQEINKNK
jgi:hypothetical protein